MPIHTDLVNEIRLSTKNPHDCFFSLCRQNIISLRDFAASTSLELSMTPRPRLVVRTGDQLKTWLDTVKYDVEGLDSQIVYGVRRW